MGTDWIFLPFKIDSTLTFVDEFSLSQNHKGNFCWPSVVAVVKCSPSIPMIRVQILRKPTVFSAKFVFELNESKTKMNEAEFGPLKIKIFCLSLEMCLHWRRKRYWCNCHKLSSAMLSNALSLAWFASQKFLIWKCFVNKTFRLTTTTATKLNETSKAKNIAKFPLYHFYVICFDS